jgi:ssRNA-specific RNase YbeY (16S rRNA maturation enzyme)
VAQSSFQPFQKTNGKRERRKTLHISKEEMEELLERDRRWREEERSTNLVSMIYEENKHSSSQSDA